MDGVFDADRGFADLEYGQPEGQPVTEKRRFGEVAGQMHGRRAPAVFPDDLVPGKTDHGPEFFDHAIQDVEIGGVISGAGDVAIAEVQHAVGGEGDGHLVS